MPSPAKRIAVLKANINRYNRVYTPPPGWPAGGLWRTPNMTRMAAYSNWKRELKNLQSRAARTIQKYARAAATRRRARAIRTISRSNLPRLPANLMKLITSVGRR